MITEAMVEAAARVLAWKARREHASKEAADLYAEGAWQQWVDSASAALQAAERAAWRPIETAPKDGRAVLLLSVAHDVGIDGETFHHPAKCHIGQWNAEGTSWTDELGGFEGEICTLTETGVWNSGGGWFQPNEITHWRPLPDPPLQQLGLAADLVSPAS